MFMLRDAIAHIRPEAQFSTKDNREVIWLDDLQREPTATEIQEAYADLERLEAQKIFEKAALLEKLGITEDEAKLLLG